MPNLTTNYSFNLPLVADPIDADLWGGQLNSNWSSVDTILNNILTAANAPKNTAGIVDKAVTLAKQADGTANTLQGWNATGVVSSVTAGTGIEISGGSVNARFAVANDIVTRDATKIITANQVGRSVVLASGSVSNAASFTINNIALLGAYPEFELAIDGLISSIDDRALIMESSIDNGVTFLGANSYRSMIQRTGSNSGSVVLATDNISPYNFLTSGSGSNFGIGNTAIAAASVRLRILNPSSTTVYKHYTGELVNYFPGSAASLRSSLSGAIVTVNPVNAIRLSIFQASMTCSYRLYGIA